MVGRLSWWYLAGIVLELHSEVREDLRRARSPLSRQMSLQEGDDDDDELIFQMQ